MTGRLFSIDLGPMSLPFHEQADSYGLDNIALKSDIEKLNALLRDGGKKKNQNYESDDEKILSSNNSVNIFTVNKENEKINELCSSISKAFTSTIQLGYKSRIATVELKICESLLPDSSITASHTDNQFYFELCVGDDNYRYWLIEKLPELVIQISVRINRSFVVAVFDPNKRTAPVATQSWPEVGNIDADN
jgi:hypothetical protein